MYVFVKDIYASSKIFFSFSTDHLLTKENVNRPQFFTF